MTMRKLIVPVTVVGLLTAAAAIAEPVSVNGGFTSFSGCVGDSSGGITQTLNGVSFVGTGAACGTGVAQADFSFAKTNSVTFTNNGAGGNPAFDNTPNVISFTPAAPQNVATVGDSFLLGTLTFSNGIWTGDAAFGFTLTSSSSDPLMNGFTFNDTLVYHLTPNDFVNNTYAQNADYLQFVLNPVPDPLLAYELSDSPNGSNTASVSVMGHIGSLHVDSFTNATGGGQVGFTTSPVPEPSTLALFSIGLVVVGFLRHQKTTLARPSLGFARLFRAIRPATLRMQAC